MPILTNSAGQLVVVASINDMRGRFLLDTGASTTVISSELATRLGLRLREFSAPTNVKQQLKMARIRSLELGKEMYREFYVVVLDLSHFSRISDTPVDGIIGVNLLKQSPFSIHIAGACLSMNPSRITGRQVPIAVKNDRLYVNASIDGVDSCFVVDSGATSTCIGDVLWPTVSQGKAIRKYSGMRADADSIQVLDKDERISVTLAIGATASVDINARRSTSHIENVLGVDAMVAFVVGFDVNSCVSYWDPAGASANKTDAPNERQPRQF